MFYEGRRGVKTTVFLNDVHARVYNKYVKSLKKDKKEAEQLQDFFQKLKIGARDVNKLPLVDRALYGELLNEIDNQLKSYHNLSSGIKNLFKRHNEKSFLQGDYFERELTAIIQSVAYKVSDKIQIPNTEIRVGQKAGTTTLTKELINSISKEIAAGLTEEQAIAKVVYKDDLYQKRVQIKTDIQGVDVNISAEAPKDLIKLQKLLSKATFSAKSYSSGRYNRETNKIEMLQEINPYIHLGGSKNPYRAIYGTLSSLGYHNATIKSGYYASRELIKKKNQKVINHIYHLRYVYELTGAGTKTIGDQFKEARFLIYNDPATDNIYVKSASEILEEIFSNQNDWEGDPFGDIRISKSKFQ